MRIVLSFMLLTWAACARPAPVEPRARPIDPERCTAVDPAFGTVVIRGRWHGRDVRVHVDTGGPSGAIAPSAARTLTARPGETVRYAGASGAFRESSNYDVEGLSIGKLALASFVAHEMPMMDGQYDLQLGLAELAPYVVDFDLEEGWFCLRDRLPDGIDGARLRPIALADNLRDITVDATLAGTPMTSMTFDTGAGVSTINEDLLSRFSHRRLDTKVQSLDGSGVVEDEYFVEVSQLCVFGVCEPRQAIMPGADLSQLVGHPQQGIIGVPFFFRHRVILDFPGRRMAILP